MMMRDTSSYPKDRTRCESLAVGLEGCPWPPRGVASSHGEPRGRGTTRPRKT